jgi:pimeloyl-ACP methyl ester carboxylesterase
MTSHTAASERRSEAMATRLVFLPGASGDVTFWRPVADRLQHHGERVHLGWPGFGSTPADPAVQGFDDLFHRVISRLDRPSALIAQSMGGVLALQAALARPSQVTHLVLTVTSGGLPLAEYGAEDWRQAFQTAHPQLPDWFSTAQVDLRDRLPALTIPILLLWGDADPISPVGVGERLATLLPCCRLVVLPGGTHDLAVEQADPVARMIDQHLLDARPKPYLSPGRAG